MSRGLVLGILVGALGLLSPLFTKTYIDEVYPSKDLGLMHVLVVGMLTLTMATALMGAIRNYHSQVVSAQLGRAVSLMYFNHLQHLPVRFFDEHRVGEIMSRFADVRSALNSAAAVLQTVVVNGTFILVVPPVLFVVNWRLALLALSTTPVTTAIAVASGRILRRWWKRAAELSAELSAFQLEALSQIRTLKSMGVEDHVCRRASQQMSDAMHLQLRSAAASALVGVVSGLVRALGTALYTWYAWTWIVRGELTLGGFMAFTAYLGYLTGPVGQITGLFGSFQRMSVTLGRAFEYLDAEPEQDPVSAYRSFAPVQCRVDGDIEFCGVGFSYDPARPVLRNVNVRIGAGTVCALVGPSGAGKSTLLRLIARFDSPTTGTVLIGNKGLSSFPLRDLRRQIAVVWQDFPLLRGTVRDNLTFGLPDSSPAQLESVLRTCQLETFVADLPEGVETPVAEWGATLSGGQRQRLAIARALMRRCPIILFDEVTSQLDAPTEQQLVRSVLASLPGTTVVLVTHRPVTASMADTVVVLQDGRVSGVGSHRQMAVSNEWYGSMQSRSAPLDANPLHLVAASTS